MKLEHGHWSIVQDDRCKADEYRLIYDDGRTKHSWLPHGALELQELACVIAEWEDLTDDMPHDYCHYCGDELIDGLEKDICSVCAAEERDEIEREAAE